MRSSLPSSSSLSSIPLMVMSSGTAFVYEYTPYNFQRRRCSQDLLFVILIRLILRVQKTLVYVNVHDFFSAATTESSSLSTSHRFLLPCMPSDSSSLPLTGTGVLGAETTRFKRSVWHRSFNTLADLPKEPIKLLESTCHSQSKQSFLCFDH